MTVKARNLIETAHEGMLGLDHGFVVIVVLKFEFAQVAIVMFVLFQPEPGLCKEQILLIDLLGMEEMFRHMSAGEGDAFIIHKKQSGRSGPNLVRSIIPHDRMDRPGTAVHFFNGFYKHKFVPSSETLFFEVKLYKYPMKIALKYGFIYAGASILMSLIMYITGLNRTDSTWLITLIGLAVPVVCILLAVKEYKAELGGGFMKFSDIFKHGLVICLIGGIIYSAYSILYIQVIDPTFMDYIMEKQVTKMQEMGMDDDAIEKAMKGSASMQSPFWMFTFSLLGSLFAGAIISLIMAAILKKPNPEEIV